MSARSVILLTQVRERERILQQRCLRVPRVPRRPSVVRRRQDGKVRRMAHRSPQLRCMHAQGECSAGRKPTSPSRSRIIDNGALVGTFTDLSAPRASRASMPAASEAAFVLNRRADPGSQPTVRCWTLNIGQLIRLSSLTYMYMTVCEVVRSLAVLYLFSSRNVRRFEMRHRSAIKVTPTSLPPPSVPSLCGA